jgi:glycosyltransferase family protein
MNILKRAQLSWIYRRKLIVDAIFGLIVWKPNILSIEESVKLILKKNYSISRFGDGEMDLILGGINLGFQKANTALGDNLKRVLQNHDNNVLIGLPVALKTMRFMNRNDKRFWRNHLAVSRRFWYSFINKNETYIDANISRFYTIYNDKSKADAQIIEIRKLWENRDVVFVEGEYSRLGVGNNCFDNTKSIRRILAPAENAFDKYDEILKEVKKLSKDVLILLALGPTATVLANDLASFGFQALDIGHVDVEYEWWRMGAKCKVPIRGKYNNEGFISGLQSSPVYGELTDEENYRYNRQIIVKIK